MLLRNGGSIGWLRFMVQLIEASIWVTQLSAIDLMSVLSAS